MAWAVECKDSYTKWNDASKISEDISSKKVNTPSSAVQEVILALSAQNKNYLGGLQVLLDKLISIKQEEYGRYRSCRNR